MNSFERLRPQLERDEGTLAPEWLTVPQACAFSHMGRTSLYSYLDINGGVIKTACIRRRNTIKGKRLVSIDSLRAFIESCSEEGSPQ